MDIIDGWESISSFLGEFANNLDSISDAIPPFLRVVVGLYVVACIVRALNPFT